MHFWDKLGNKKSVLLTIYKALILSRIDYCCFIYENCSHSQTKKLDTIQYKSLLLATGGMKGTALNALLGECCELPLELRRKNLVLKYLLKIYLNPKNSASIVLKDTKYYQMGFKAYSPYTNLLDNFFSDLGVELNTVNQVSYNASPWSEMYSRVDMSYEFSNTKGDKNKNTDDLKIQHKVDKLCNDYEYVFFVDGSVRADNKVGVALSLPQSKTVVRARLPNNLSIYYAEAYAILMALNYAKENNFHDFCIITDSQNVLNDIKFSNVKNSPHSNLISTICNIFNDTHKLSAKFIWLPGHSNIPCLQEIDSLAKLATNLTDITPIDPTFQEFILGVDGWIRNKWVEKWSNEPNCKYQRTFCIRETCLTSNSNRKKDTIINRLRLLQTKLKAGLAKIGLLEDGACQTCGVLEDVYHFVMMCKNTEDLRQKLYSVKSKVNLFSFQELLPDVEIMDNIADYVA